jgi:FKBP-type peptidyl-prolyl cis-trans isomerase FkpA
MKKVFFSSIFLAGIILFSGCLRDDSEKLKEEEQASLKKYLKNNNITQQPTASGLYFIPVTDTTVGLSPTIDDVVEFEYTGWLVDGQLFGTTDSATAKEKDIYYESIVYGPVRLILSNAILGLAEGFQLMQEGEIARMILPSDIAYDGNSIGLIPRYSTLIFDIQLLKVISDPEEYEQNLLTEFLDSNNYDVTPTESGLYYIEKDPGDSVLIKNGNVVDLYYKGYFLDGRVFDSNLEDDDPLTTSIPNDYLIKGLNEGLKLMSNGSKGILIIPYDMAYGEYGTSIVGPYMTLVFDIEIKDVR